MKLDVQIDLDELVIDEWDTTVSQLVLQELKSEITREVKKAIKEDKQLKKAIALIRDAAAGQIIKSMTKE